MKKPGLLIMLSLLLLHFAFAQPRPVSRARMQQPTQKDSGHTVPAVIINGDTLPVIDMPVMSTNDAPDEATLKEQADWRLLKKRISWTYPIACSIAKTKHDIDSLTLLMERHKDKKKLLHEKIDSLKDQYEAQVKNFSIQTGGILVKLLYRQTNMTAYDLIRSYGGWVKAQGWQTVGWTAGVSLKQKYDPVNDPQDRLIEEALKELHYP
jgi:hypothetical protein